MNALKPEIITLFKHRQQLAKWLRDHGKAKEEINNLLENWSVEERQGPSGRHHSFSSSISPGNMGRPSQGPWLLPAHISLGPHIYFLFQTILNY